MPALASIAKNSVANLTRMGTSWLLALFLPPLLVRVLDKPVYATWVLILQVGAYVGLIDASIQSVVGRFVARAEVLDDSRYMGRMLSSAAALMLFASLSAAILIVLGSWQLEHLFPNIPASISSDARQALLIVGLSLVFSLPFSTLAGTFFGLQKNEVNALAGSLGKIVGAVGAAWAAYHHQRLYIMATWIALGNLLQAAAYLWAWSLLKMKGVLRWANVDKAAVKEFVTFCYAVIATQIGSILITGIDLPIVAAFDFHSAAYYAVAATVSNMLIVPQGAIVGTLIPIASGMSAIQDPIRMGEAVLRTTRYATALLCILALPLLLGIQSFLTLWVGPDYARHALLSAVILIVAQFVRLTLMPYASIGFAAGQQHQMLITLLGEGVANVVFSLIGVHLVGAVGVAWGTLLGAFVSVVLHFIISMPRTNAMQFSRKFLIRDGIIRPVLCCLPSAALIGVLMGQEMHLATKCVLIFGAELSAILILYKVNFNLRERKELTDLLIRAVRRWSRRAKAVA